MMGAFRKVGTNRSTRTTSICRNNRNHFRVCSQNVREPKGVAGKKSEKGKRKYMVSGFSYAINLAIINYTFYKNVGGGGGVGVVSIFTHPSKKG